MGAGNVEELLPNPPGIGLGRSGGGGGSRDENPVGVGLGGAGCLRDGFGLGGRFLNNKLVKFKIVLYILFVLHTLQMTIESRMCPESSMKSLMLRNYS